MMAPPKKKPTSTIVTRSASAAATPPLPPAPVVIDEPMDVEVPASSTPPSTSKGATGGTATPPRPPPATSPTKCAICLGELVNSCYTNSCMHQFCFACLLQWSKVKPECPLCKSLFQSIYHNIRNNDDYDEYNVPSPTENMPTLSIHFAAHDAFSPNPYRTSATFRRLNHPHSFLTPTLHEQYHDHGYSFHRFMRERARVDRMRDPSYIRILEMGPITEPRAFDLMNMNTSVGGRPPLDNPFYSEEPELFGSFSTTPAAGSRFSNPRGSVVRRRIYDRGQYVQSFNATTIPPGTVFFPSVEYFRTHPGSYSRVSEWLHRELSVLLGLNYSRSEMANVYDTIFTLLFRFDIRSTEFREMLRGYLGNRTRHFQHEFYNFVLSGMRIEEYDRLCVYSSPSRSGTATRPGQVSPAVPHTDQPILVTISDDETNDVSEVDASGQTGNDTRRGPRGTVIQNAEIVLSEDEGSQDRVVPVTSSSAQGTSAHLPGASQTRNPSGSLEEMLRLNEDDWAVGGVAPGPTASDGSHFHILSPRAHRHRHRPRTTISEDRARRLDDFRSRLEDRRQLRSEAMPYSLSGIRSPPPAHSSSGSTNLEFQRPSRSGRPYVSIASTSERTEPGIDDTWAWLGLGGTQRSTAGTSRSTDRPRDGCRYGETPVEESWMDEVPHQVNLSCAPLTFGVGVRISQNQASRSRPENFSTSGRRRPSPSQHDDSVEEVLAATLPKPSVSSAALSKSAPAPPPPPVVGPSDDSDEVELLGVHAIVKPPPLAVITLSSDDEDEDATRKLKTEKLAGRDPPIPATPASPDLVIDDEFLNWTLDRNTRIGFDMFPLIDNDEVQTLAHLRPGLGSPIDSSRSAFPSSSTALSDLPLPSSAFLPYDPSGASHKYKRNCKKGDSKTKTKSRGKKASKSRKRKSTPSPTNLSDSEDSDLTPPQVDSEAKHGRSTKREKLSKHATKTDKSKSKVSREEKKMATINRLIAQMEAREKRNQKPGPSRESKPRKRKNLFLSPSPSSGSADSDTIVDDSIPSSSSNIPLKQFKRARPIQRPVPGPSSAAAVSSSAPGPSTSFSAQAPSSSSLGLLDLRTLDKKILPEPSRERRWESDDGQDSPPLRNMLTTAYADSDSSFSSGCRMFGSPRARGMTPRNFVSEARGYLGHRDHSPSSSDEDEQLFAPETDSESSDRHYGAEAGAREEEPSRISVAVLSPPLPFQGADFEAIRAATQDQAHTFGTRSRLGSERLFQPYAHVLPSSSDEDDGGLLDLSVASGPLPPNDTHSAIVTNPGHSFRGSHREGYWAEAHDWMGGGSE